MKIIPVLDLMSGIVVHARKGQRAHYRPVATPLCRDASPHAVIEGLLGLYPFDTIYVADLDALMGKGEQRGALVRLHSDYPELTFWIDQGWSGSCAISQPANGVPVIGSESLSEENLSRLAARRGKFILSLDFMADQLLGAQSLIQRSELWPERVIIMSLSRVGDNEGPDFQRLRKFRARWPGKKFFAAGGVRGEDDLKRLKDLGIHGVLVASALHSGALSSSVLQNYM